MAGNQENFPVVHSNSSGTDTSKSGRSMYRKRKANDLMPEPPAPREVNESIVKLLFEKKLTHSDAEGKDRIIIPKAYAEIVFPETATEPCLYFMDDMAAVKVWTFSIRSWAKGASKIYVLEGAAEYILEHGIKEGDYIKIYRDREVERFAIGWRKHDKDHDKSMAGRVKNVDLPTSSSEVALDDKNAIPAVSSDVASLEKNALPDSSSGIDFADDDYHPQFSPYEETYQRVDEVVDPEYVQKNLNMSWDEFQEFNPFDFP